MTVEERGSVTILAVGLALVCFAIAGLAVDGTRAFLARRSLQNVADSSAIAAAGQIDTQRYYRSEGATITLQSRVAEESARRMLARRAIDGSALVFADVDRVEVLLRSRVNTSFLRLVGINSIPVAASASSSPFLQQIPIGR